MTILLIDIVTVQFDTFVCTLIFKTNNVILCPKYNIFKLAVLAFQDFECSVVCPLGCISLCELSSKAVFHI